MKKFIIALVLIVIAFVILLVSIFDSSSITYSLSVTPPQPFSGIEGSKVNYIFPYAGKILPDSPFWGLKALRDKVWYNLTASPLRRAQLALLFADKRVVMAEKLFKQKECNIAMSTFIKGERYLSIAVEQEKIARSRGINTDKFLEQLALSALKHIEVAEYLIQLVPEDSGPMINKNESYAKDAYEAAKNALITRGLAAPINPFIGE